MNFEIVYQESADGRDFWVAYRYSDTHWRVIGTGPHPGWLTNEEAAEWESLGAAPDALSVSPSNADLSVA